MNETVRKLLVSLKRKPQLIAELVLAAAFLVYSLNLSDISNTTAKIQGQGMGLCGFCTMLFSMLSFVCFLNAFPKRKKANIPMLVIMFAMFALIIFCDVSYLGKINNALTRADNPIAVTDVTYYIGEARSVLKAHIAVLSAAIALIVTLPVYKKWIKKINTSVNVEDYGSLDAIDISGED